MKKINNQAFTLVELLIVVAILAVLATVGFVSYSNYLTGVRDTNRVTQLVGIRNAIETFKTTKDTPLPEEKIDIKVNEELIAYQGIVGQNILNQIGLSDGGTDPKDETYFPYYLTRDRKYFQLMTFLEDEPDKEEELTFFPQTYASTDYSIRYPKVIGFPLGILTEKDTNTPLHEIESLTNSGYLDVATTSDEYTAYFMDEDTITGSGDVLPSIVQNASCKRILDMGRSKGDGIYTINPTGTESFQVYCDMTTDGGGWTLVLNISQGETAFFFSSANWSNEDVLNTSIFMDNVTSKYKSYSLVYGENFLVDIGGVNFYLKANGKTALEKIVDGLQDKQFDTGQTCSARELAVSEGYKEIMKLQPDIIWKGINLAPSGGNSARFGWIADNQNPSNMGVTSDSAFGLGIRANGRNLSSGRMSWANSHCSGDAFSGEESMYGKLYIR